MKPLQLFTLTIVAASLVSCESTDVAQNRGAAGNQEAKRLAAAREEQRQDPDVDESKRNLWNAQHDILTRDSNPVLRYY